MYRQANGTLLVRFGRLPVGPLRYLHHVRLTQNEGGALLSATTPDGREVARAAARLTKSLLLSCIHGDQLRRVWPASLALLLRLSVSLAPNATLELAVFNFLLAACSPLAFKNS